MKNLGPRRLVAVRRGPREMGLPESQVPQLPRDRHREVEGEVVSDKMAKTVVVVVKRLTRHAKYGKVIRRVTRIKAHDEKNECHVGDKVRVRETRPLSKDKHFRVIQVVE